MKASLLTMLAACSIAAGTHLPTRAASPDSRCNALQSTNFSDVKDAPPIITRARIVQANASVPVHCLVEGRLPVAPSQEFELRLPLAGWNGKFLGIPNIGSGDVCNGYVKRGYACAPMFRNGKKGRSDSEGSLAIDRSSFNQLDSHYMQAHLLTLSGKAIVDRYYGARPTKSYFMGCSGGGYSALTLAQSFPWDYDGIIAADPNVDVADWSIRAIWTFRSLQDDKKQPILSGDDTRLLHGAVLSQCDMDDGVKDGVLGNAVGCSFDASALACKGAKTPSCLTATQIDAIKRVYDGPRTSDGLQLTASGVLPGSELYWPSLTAYGGLGTLALKYSFGGTTPAIDASNFDFDRDYKRLGPGALDPRGNPDLRKFKTAGGRLLVHVGTSDIAQLVPSIVDYYEITERAMGGRRATQDFFRMFMVPGATHCGRGAGADAVDYLSYLEAWVERGKAPDRLIAARVSDAYLATAPLPELPPAVLSNITPEQRAAFAASALHYPLDPSIPITFTRPLYPYPVFARYTGRGDPNDAANFVPVEPHSAREKPAVD